MVKIYQSAVIPAPVADVWQVAGDYARIYAFHPAVKSTKIEAGPAADQVGSVRLCTLEDGAQLLETQTARSDAEHTYSYAITESPMPMKNYEGTVRLRPVTDGDTTFIEWSATFDPNPEVADELPGMVSGLVAAGLESLKARFADGETA